MNKFNELQISESLLKAIADIGYIQPTEIQKQAIPAILEGRDVLGKSNTGTGKTAAFGIPTIEMIEPGLKLCDTLVVCPTRELALQITNELRKFAKYKEGIRIVSVYGGEPIERQIQQLKKGAPIIVGTPGRIMDHLRRKTIKFNALNRVILDEADEMLNMGFKEDIEEILQSVPHNDYQMILFSATMPESILKITKQFQENPLVVEIQSKQRTIDTVTQHYYEIPKGKKDDALLLLLNQYNASSTMIFANTKRQVDILVDELQKNNLKAIGLHGDMKQQFRTRVLEQFKARNYTILIATDVAARGIDIDDIELVINYDLPQDNEYYIHRVGRTGRAGKTGIAITLLEGRRQEKEMNYIAKSTKTTIQKQALPTVNEIRELQKQLYIQTLREQMEYPFTNESEAILQQLQSEGYTNEMIIKALISQTFVVKEIDLTISERKKSTLKDVRTIKINLGKNARISASHIIAAICDASGISGDKIGRVAIRNDFSLVDIDAKEVYNVLASLETTTINQLTFVAELDIKKSQKQRQTCNKQESKKQDGVKSKKRELKNRKETSKERKRRKGLKNR